MNVKFWNVSRLSSWLFDIRIWILVLFVIRLENINLPPLDEHSLRQTLTLMVSRNMIEISPNPLAPTISFGAGSQPGHVAMEPGIYNGLTALSYLLFGEHNWNSRLINLLVSSAGLWFFYAFLRRFWKPEAALASVVIYGVSIAFIYGRKTMPDTFALSFVFAGVYYGTQYLSGNARYLMHYILTMSLGLLTKFPMSCAAVLLLWPLLEYKPTRQTFLRFVLASGIPILLVALWYFWWLPDMIKNGWMRMYETYGFMEGWRQFWALREGVWDNFSRVQMGSYWPFALLLPGIFAMGWHKQRNMALAVLASAAVFSVFIIQAAYAYPTHEYYGIPFNPAYAMISGFGLAHLLGHWRVLLLSALLLIAYSGIKKQKEDFFMLPESRKYLQLAQLADSVSQQGDKFLVNDAVYARMLYFLHRQGRSEGSDLFRKYPEWVHDYGREGIRYICIDRSTLADTLAYPVVAETPDFRIYRHSWSPENQSLVPQ